MERPWKIKKSIDAVSLSCVCVCIVFFFWRSFVFRFQFLIWIFPRDPFPCGRLLRNIYGSGYLNALSSLAEQSNQLRDMVNQSLFDDFYANNVQRSGLCVWFQCQSYLSQPLFFWKEILREICHSMGSNMISEKAIKEFMTRLKPPSATGKRVDNGTKTSKQHNRSSNSQHGRNGNGNGNKNKNKNGNGKRQQQQEEDQTSQARKKQKMDDAVDTMGAATPMAPTASATKPPPQQRRHQQHRRLTKYPKDGWPALKKNSLSFFHNGTLYMFEPVFSSASKAVVPTGLSFAVDGPSVRINAWTIGVTTMLLGGAGNATSTATPTAVGLTMDNVLSGQFEYVLPLYQGQSLCVGQVKGLTHPAGHLDPKFRKMIPFLTVTGKPKSMCSYVKIQFLFSADWHKE
jgi:hypothetical protein